MKRERSYPPVVVSVLLLLVLSACGAATPSPTATASIPPTAPPAAVALPTDTLTTAPTPTLAPAAYPPERGYHTMVYDAAADAVLMFGGMPDLNSQYGDAWSYKTGTNAWTLLTPISQALYTSAYDSKADRVILYASLGISGTVYHKLSDTYTYDLNSDKLQKVSPTSSPFGLLGGQMVYDSESDRTILFGGYDFVKDLVLDETWAYDLNSNTWAQMKPAEHPSGRNYQSMAYIPTIDRVLLYGGDTTDFDTQGEKTVDTWLYDYKHDSWTMIDPSSKPPDRYYSSMVYISSIDRVLMVGGESNAAGGVIGDLWSFDPKTLNWEELHPANEPGKRAWHAMAYDSKADKVVLFGGGPNKGPWTDETWIYDPQANSWTNVTPKE